LFVPNKLLVHKDYKSLLYNSEASMSATGVFAPWLQRKNLCSNQGVYQVVV